MSVTTIKKTKSRPGLVWALEKVYTAGVDEVGRGCLAGPVVAAAVILDPSKRIRGLADSKVLTAQQREALFPIIQQHALAWALGRAEVEEIDKLNIFHASLLAMRRAVLALAGPVEHIVVDGMHCPPQLPYSAEAIIGGDAKIAAISAASILAKVTRDSEMILLDQQYPEYGFSAHKGYATEQHRIAIEHYGRCPLHRLSFKVKAEKISN